MKSVVIVVILAVAAYFLLRPTTFTVKNDIFMYKSPEDVYEFMSDLKRTIEKHSIGGKCSLLRQRTRQDGVKEKLFLVEKAIPLFWDYELPFNLEIRLTLAKPNKEFLYNFGFLRGYLLKVQGRLTFERREGRAMPGTFLTEELTVTCPWLAKMFVEKNLRETHKDILISLRNGLESMQVSGGRTKDKEETVGGREEGGKMKTEKKKETGSADGKAKASLKDEANMKASKPSEKKEKQSTKDQKMERKASQDADAKPRRSEKEEERKETSRQDKKETSKKDEHPIKEDKTEKKASPGEDVKPKKDEEGKKTGDKHQKSKTEKHVKKKEVRVKDGGEGKEAEQRKEERVKIEKKEQREDAKDVKKEKKVEQEERAQKETQSKEKIRMEGRGQGGKPEQAKQSGTGGQKRPEAPKVEKETKKQKAKTGG